MQPSPISERRVDKAIEDGWKRQVLRVIAHVDLDAFYCQVEVKNDPERLRGKPVGVMQYNPFGDLASFAPSEDRLFNDSNGSLIAVSYEARAFGVKRNMRGEEARKVCPDLLQVQVPTAHGKADLTHYRAAGKQVTDILARLSICEKASIDECYLDITKEARRRLDSSSGALPLPVNVQELHVCGHEDISAAEWWQRSEEEWTDEEKLLACGAAAVADLRAAVKTELGFTCSAGVSNCKILAKLASGMHKPSQQTVVPAGSVPGLLEDLPVPKLRQLGGKLGDEVMRVLNLKTVGELARVPKARLTSFFPDSQACWLHELAHGIDEDEVKQRTLPKSIGCGKTFHGKHTLYAVDEVSKWVGELAKELEERVNVDQEENSREPKLVTIHASSSAVSYHGTAISRSGPLRRPTADIISEDAINLLKKWTSMTPGWSITGLSLVVSNFVAAPRGKSTLTRFFKPNTKQDMSDTQTAQPPVGKEEFKALAAPLQHNRPEEPSQTPSANKLNRLASDSSDAPGRHLRKRSAEPIHFPWVKKPRGAPTSRLDLGTENEVRLQGSESVNDDLSMQPPKLLPHDVKQDGHLISENESLPAENLKQTNQTPEDLPGNVDREVWNSLPKEIQRELRLESMAASRQKPKQNELSRLHVRTQKKKGSDKPIANFFAKKP